MPQKFQLSKVALIPIILFGVFLLIISRRLLSDWTNEKDIIGEIEFKEEYLIIAESENRLNYKEIECIYFRYNFIKGRSFAPKDYIHNGLTELNLTTKVGEVKKINFIIESNEQFEYLKTIFKKWYQQGIEINEEFMNQKLKTICLEVVGNKSYKEIQELKNKK